MITLIFASLSFVELCYSFTKVVTDPRYKADVERRIWEKERKKRLGE